MLKYPLAFPFRAHAITGIAQASAATPRKVLRVHMSRPPFLLCFSADYRNIGTGAQSVNVYCMERQWSGREAMTAKARSSATPAAQRTMTRFLGATEREFAKHGYEGTTIRAVATRARVNLGTLKHYWGSKRALFRHLFERRFQPLKQEHLRRLRAIEVATPKGGRPDRSAVMRSLIEATFFIDWKTGSGFSSELFGFAARRQFRLLYGRALMDPSPIVVAEMTRIFEEPLRLFLTLMRKACPELSRAELDWRINCIIGAQVFSQIYSQKVGRFLDRQADVAESVASNWILHFLLDGLNAPPFRPET